MTIDRPDRQSREADREVVVVAGLPFGDGHYAMGEVEIIGTAVEGAVHVELRVDLEGLLLTGRGARGRRLP